MRLRTQAHRGRSLFHGLQSIFDLVQTTLGREDGVIGVVGIPELCLRVNIDFQGVAENIPWRRRRRRKCKRYGSAGRVLKVTRRGRRARPAQDLPFLEWYRWFGRRLGGAHNLHATWSDHLRHTNRNAPVGPALLQDQGRCFYHPLSTCITSHN